MARGFAARVLRFRRAVTLQRKIRDCSQSRRVARSHARTARERRREWDRRRNPPLLSRGFAARSRVVLQLAWIINGELASRLSGTRTNHPCRLVEPGKLL